MGSRSGFTFRIDLVLRKESICVETLLSSTTRMVLPLLGNPAELLDAATGFRNSSPQAIEGMDSALTVIIDLLKTAAGEEYTLIRDVPDDLERLKGKMSAIFNVRKDAELRQVSDHHALIDWLNKVYDAAYDAEDAVDMFTTETLRRRSNNTSRTAGFISWVNDFFSWSANHLLFRHRMGRRIQKAFGRLVDIAEERKLHLTERDGGVANLASNRLQTISGLEDVVFGRERDLEIVTARLIDVKTDMEVVVLVGMGGVGKTTLAKLVYRDGRVDNLFAGRKAWVCVSEDFDLMKIAIDIIKQRQIHGESYIQFQGLESSLEALNPRLKKIFNGNKFLLVLDDVWNQSTTKSGLSRENWGQMKSLFDNCKILVTTRDENVTSLMSEFYLHHVGCLPEGACWSLFEKMAFRGGIVRKELKEIGERIVGRCKGLPLAVTLLGRVMSSKKEPSEWLMVEENDIWDIRTDETEILSALRLSYNHLPLESRFCFAYCSIFPKDCDINKMELIKQWTGNGFISPNEAKEMEHTGMEIFEDLLSRCFFQDAKKDFYGNITSCKMHDLIHDLAKSIVKYECGILQNSNQDGFLSDKRIRFLSIDMGKQPLEIPIKLDDAPTLRTLQCFSPQLISKLFLVNVFKKLKFLRVLNLSGAHIEDVPSSIDNLKLLRYVDFSNTRIKQLPETACRLQNLQTMKLNFCRLLRVLPKNLRKLSKLRHLEIESCPLDTMPVRMDQLSLLQTLTDFTVSNHGATLNELRQLKLGSGLCIRNLERTRNDMQPVLGNGIFSSKYNLVSLNLSWKNIGSSSDSNDRDGNVLNALQPHAFLKQLKLSNFSGIQFPTWMTDSSQLLVKVTLSYCSNCACLPAFGKLPKLRNLQIMGLKKVRKIDETFYGVSETNGFPCLEEFALSDMPIFKEWSGVQGRESFPFLRTLTIKDCPNLEVMPQIPTLCRLEIWNCSKLLLRSVANLPSLSTLLICRIPELTCLTDNSFENLTALTKLCITDCMLLKSFSDNAIKHVSSLQHMEISGCKELKSLPNSMGSLRSLTNLIIENCLSLAEVSGGLECLTSLRSIAIVGCLHTTNWSNLAIRRMCSVQQLRIELCNKDNVDLSRWLQNSQKITSLRIHGGHGFNCFPVLQDDLENMPVLSICCFEQLELLRDDLENMPVLEHLEIRKCSKLTTLPVKLGEMTTLQTLSVVDCPNLTCLPGRLNVQFLWISGCTLLEARCKEQGEDWHFISHIPRKVIG